MKAWSPVASIERQRRESRQHGVQMHRAAKGMAGRSSAASPSALPVAAMALPGFSPRAVPAWEVAREKRDSHRHFLRLLGLALAFTVLLVSLMVAELAVFYAVGAAVRMLTIDWPIQRYSQADRP